MTKTFEDDLVLEGDTTFKQSIKVKGDIRGKDGRKFDLEVYGNIDAWNIDARDIYAWNIDALDIEARDMDALDIDARDIDAGNIEALNIDARDIDAQEISFYAFCIAYKNIRCTSIEGRRHNSKYLALDGEVEIKEREKCPECGQKLEEEVEKS